ncbi:MAG: helix-turn-helix transcriptional regulator [Clostridiales bacterium]|nr:helix-turn-helix transcriptional regulator [Clostridiales bacterium]
MELKLAENIRRLRKEKPMTQEALADALGVTVGAVYKWEADLSTPELPMLVKLAELFDTSVDTLIGYESTDNSKQVIIDRIYGYSAKKDRKAIEEADLALAKYPNDYWVVLAAANIYSNFGVEEKPKNKAMIRKAIALFEKAARIVPHDADPKYGKLAALGSSATLYYFIDEKDKALTMLKKHNEAGIFDARIVAMMTMNGDTSDNCQWRIVDSFWRTCSDIFNTSNALLLFYKNRGELERIKTLARWSIEYVTSIRKNDDPCFLDKMIASFTMAESYAYFKGGDPDKALNLMKKAKEIGDRFDQAPNYGTDIIKLFDNKSEGTLVDVLGKTAHESIENLLEIIGDKKFSSAWRNLNK